MKTVTMGNETLTLDSPQLGRLRDANGLLGDRAGLHERLAEDGYLLIRGLHDPARVRAARDVVIRYLDGKGQLDRSRPLDEAWAHPAVKGGGLLSRVPEVAGSDEVLSVLEGERVMSFFADLLGGEVFTFPYKWLRAVPPGSNTGAHYDVVYMGRGTLELFTCWTPFCDVGIDRGPLAVLVGSHRFAGLRDTYGRSDVDRDKSDGWYSRDPLDVVAKWGGQWQTAEFAMGDAMVFGMFTMHGSLNNAGGQYRLSCDTRYQLANQPVDERWVGAVPRGHDGESRTPKGRA
ncbi:MAG: hypothetical protein BIFFINMI_03668 [Phycisphaerae bacterium]|nr:hypothetical protein [Phycisphaerae bacterium]